MDKTDQALHKEESANNVRKNKLYVPIFKIL